MSVIFGLILLWGVLGYICRRDAYYFKWLVEVPMFFLLGAFAIGCLVPA